MKPVSLPEELSREDLLAVARIHFPTLVDDYLDFVVDKTFATERNYFSDLSNIAALAFCIAVDAGRAVPNVTDLKGVIAEVLPAREVAPAKPMQVHSTARASHAELPVSA